jgi:hypothetical protein
MSIVPYDPSPAVLRTLAETFWSRVGWHSPPRWPGPDAMARAVRAGIMFTGTRRLDHDAWVRTAVAAASTVTAQEAADAFLASLTTRRLDLRSALGSYALARHLREHPFTIPRELIYDGYAPVGPGDCAVCGFRGPEAEELDLNVFNFERFKWGGVRRHSVPYIAFDLEQFARAPRPRLSDADLALGRQLTRYLSGLPVAATASQAAAGMTFIKGNKAEREVILDILGVTGILQTADHPGFASAYVPAAKRHLPPRRFTDRAYPVCWWTAADGVNTAALRQFFARM